MRYIVYGAGAIGGTIAAGLHEAGMDVVAIARGPHLDAIRRGGLRVERPDSTSVTQLRVAPSPDELEVGADSVVVLAVKSQDTSRALHALASVHPDATVVCAQNGVDNERQALRRFRNVQAMYVWMAADHLEPGAVRVYASPAPGVLDIGRYPSGDDRTADAVAADLRSAGFDSRAVPDVMRWKFRKLLGNLGNAVEAVLGYDADDGGIAARARAEGLACYAAAGIEVASDEEQRARVERVSALPRAGSVRHRGGSSWQSVIRVTGSIEADYLNGEIVLMGRLHAVPTPVNETLRRAANRLAGTGGAPGDVSVAELERSIVALS